MNKSKYFWIIGAVILLIILSWLLFPRETRQKNDTGTLRINEKGSTSQQIKGVIIPDHIVIVVEENHSFQQIIGNKSAPYMNTLVKKGALMTNSHGVTHPSQPNYIALFSGSTQGIKTDSCPNTFSGENLATQLKGAGKSFAGYSEDLPHSGFTGCSNKSYARKHNPWVNFTNVRSEENVPLGIFPKDLDTLPTVSFVIPNLDHDIHNGTIAQADQWLKKHLDPYIKWADNHNSLFILTWDEDDFSPENHIPTLFVGPMVKPGKYGEFVNHYNVLRTIQALYNLPPLGKSAEAPAITTIWK